MIIQRSVCAWLFLVALVPAAPALAVAPVGSEGAATVKVASDIRAVDAFVRVPVPGRNITAAFFTLHNKAQSPVSLVAVHADFAGRAELHSHTHSDGMMRMRKEESIAIPAGGSLVFAPGGYHVMLFDLQETIKTGDQLHLRLEFADGRQLLVPAAVRSAFDHTHDHSHH